MDHSTYILHTSPFMPCMCLVNVVPLIAVFILSKFVNLQSKKVSLLLFCQSVVQKRATKLTDFRPFFFFFSSYFATYTRRKNAANTHFVRYCGVFGHLFTAPFAAPFALSLRCLCAAFCATILRCRKNAAISHKVSCLRPFCGAYKSKIDSKTPKIRFLRLPVAGFHWLALNKSKKSGGQPHTVFYIHGMRRKATNSVLKFFSRVPVHGKVQTYVGSHSAQSQR